jgi:hypothetical protein
VSNLIQYKRAFHGSLEWCAVRITLQRDNAWEEKMKYDVEKLLTVEDCDRVLDRAKAKGDKEFYAEVIERKLALAGLAFAKWRHPADDPADPLVRAFYEMLGFREELLRQKHHGKNQPATRTRRMVRDQGVMYCFNHWAGFGNRTSEGFEDFVAANMIDRTAEAIIVRFADRFGPEVVAQASHRLADARRKQRNIVDA